MRLFLTFCAVAATLALGGCADRPFAARAPMGVDVEQGGGANSLTSAAMQRNIRQKYEYVNEINDDYRDSMIDLRTRMEMRKISYSDYQLEKAEISARRTSQRYNMEREYEAGLNARRSITCHTVGQTTFCN